MNLSLESNYDEYRPLYRPIPKESEVIAYGRRPKWKQRESAYVSRKRIWRTLPEPSSPAKMIAPTSIGKTLQNSTCVITVRASFHVVKSTDRSPWFHGAYGVVISGGREWARSPLECSEMDILYLWFPYANPRKYHLEASLFTTIS